MQPSKRASARSTSQMRSLCGDDAAEAARAAMEHKMANTNVITKGLRRLFQCFTKSHGPSHVFESLVGKHADGAVVGSLVDFKNTKLFGRFSTVLVFSLAQPAALFDI